MSDLPMLIGICGRRGSGKDTVANLITELSGISTAKFAFADALKNACASMADEEVTWYHTQQGKAEKVDELGMTRGQLLQHVGQAMRGIDELFWVKCLDRARTHPAILTHLHIVTDVRMVNEAEYIRAQGGVLIHVKGDPLKQQGDGTRDDSHPSETALDGYLNFSAILQNTGTLDALQKMVENMLQHLPEMVKTNGTAIYWPKLNGGTDAPNTTTKG